MTSIDQNIWIERIKKEQAVKHKFNLVSLVNAKVGTNCSNYAVARTYLRDGQAPEVVKKRPFYMLDSTYTVASNPNTMRDTGPLRNAQYKVADPADFEYMLKTASGAKQSREEEQAIEKAMKARCTHNRPQSATPGHASLRKSGAFSFANSSINGTPAKKRINIVENVTLVAANDYTKNISELVFSPAVYVRPQTTLNGKNIPQKLAKNNQISEKRYKELEGELKSEKEKRSKIADDVRKIREQLDTIQLSVNSGSVKK